MKRTEMYTDGRYLAKNPAWNGEDAVWKAIPIKRLLDRNNIHFASAADVGCGAGELINELAKYFPLTSWIGYDISPDAIHLASKIASDKIAFYQGDYFAESDGQTDLLLCIDVIEHVSDYYGFLEKLRQKSSCFIFHIPLDLCFYSLVRSHILYQQREDAGHIHYFSKEMVLWMLKDTGYKIIDFEYTKPGLDMFPQTTLKRKIKKLLRRLSFACSKEKSIKLFGGYSMMILAT